MSQELPAAPEPRLGLTEAEWVIEEALEAVRGLDPELWSLLWPQYLQALSRRAPPPPYRRAA